MSSSGNPTHPFTLEVSPSSKGDGTWQFAIRRNGKLLERSDRVYRSEADASKDGEKALERALTNEQNPASGRFGR